MQYDTAFGGSKAKDMNDILVRNDFRPGLCHQRYHEQQSPGLCFLRTEQLYDQ